MADRAPLRCDQCGQVDDHPKWHYGAATYHHDCAPYGVIRDVTTTGYTGADGQWIDGQAIPHADLPTGIRRALKARELAEKGTRGPKLAAAIDKMHQED